MAQLALKLTDVGLDVVEGVLTVGAGEQSVVLDGVKKIHTSANTIRISGMRKAGTMTEETSLSETVMNLLGITDLLAALNYMMTTTTATPLLENVKRESEEPQLS